MTKVPGQAAKGGEGGEGNSDNAGTQKICNATFYVR